MRVIKTNLIDHESTRIPLPVRPRISENRKIALPTLEGIHFEKVEDILSLEAQGNYTMLHFRDGRQLLLSKTLRATEALVSNVYKFVRIHRSHTINLDLLNKYVRGKGGYVIMEDGSMVNVSVSRKDTFLKAVESYFSCK